MIVSVYNKSLSHMVPFLSNRSVLCWLLHVQVSQVDCMKPLSVLSFRAKTNPSQRPGKKSLDRRDKFKQLPGNCGY